MDISRRRLTKVNPGVHCSITVNAITSVETTLMKTASVAAPPAALAQAPTPGEVALLLIPHQIFDRVHGAPES